MPIYEYRCASCSFQSEYLQRVSDPLLTDCPECGKPTFNKMVTAAGFQLKGSGWYATDFKNQGSQPKADKNKENKDGDKGGEKATEKTAEKAAEKAAEKGADKSADKPAETKKEDSKSASTTSATPAGS